MQLLNIICSDDNKKFIKYFFVGGFAALVNITIFFIFAKVLKFNYLLVGAFAFIVATMVNYFLSIKYVFKSCVRFGKKQEVCLVYLISVIGLIENEAILYILVRMLEIEIMISQSIAIGAVFIWNYVARKNLIFKEV